MAQALQIDTLAFSKRLREAGADEKLAEAIVEGITAADTSDLATKGDLITVETALKSDLASVEAALKSDMGTMEAALKSDIADVRTELKSDIADVRTELKSDIADVRGEIADVRTDLKWMKGIGAAILALVAFPLIRDALAAAPQIVQ